MNVFLPASDNLCGRFFRRPGWAGCYWGLAECLLAGKCAFTDFDDETNKAFAEALESTKRMHCPRILDQDGGVQMCEQCNNADGKAVEVRGDGSLSVNRVWAHKPPFGAACCRYVYVCNTCSQAIIQAREEPWFDRSWYGVDPNRPVCRPALPG